MKNQLFSLRETAMQLRSQRPLHVQEMLANPVNRVVDPRRIIGGWEGGDAQGVAGGGRPGGGW
jgi:hypothetical protein